jgi:hypothetical protein
MTNDNERHPSLHRRFGGCCSDELSEADAITGQLRGPITATTGTLNYGDAILNSATGLRIRSIKYSVPVIYSLAALNR